MIPSSRAYLILFLLALSSVALAQPKFNSPFSRFGLGDIPNSSFPALQGMGSISASFIDDHHLNFDNPASYAFLTETSFELGFDAKRSNWMENGNSDLIWSGNLTHLALGFQLSNKINETLDGREKPVKFGMAVGLTPRTLVGYNIQVVDDVTDELQVVSDYTGEGGVYNLTWGNSVRYKNFGFGVNMNYLFGNIETTANGTPSTNNSYRYNTSNDYSIRGFLWDIGGIYKLKLKDPLKEKDELPSRKSLVFGLHLGTGSTFNTNQDQLVTRLSQTGDLDTFSVLNQIDGNGKLPAELGFGVTYMIKDKLRVGVNYKTSDWSSYYNDAAPGDVLAGSSTISIGGEYIPDNTSITNYGKRMRFRAGFLYNKDPRTILNTSLTKTAVTLGLGIPVLLARQQASYVNFSLELGKFGSSESLTENYIKLGLGFTLNDNLWFFKRKFN